MAETFTVGSFSRLKFEAPSVGQATSASPSTSAAPRSAPSAAPRAAPCPNSAAGQALRTSWLRGSTVFRADGSATQVESAVRAALASTFQMRASDVTVQAVQGDPAAITSRRLSAPAQEPEHAQAPARALDDGQGARRKMFKWVQSEQQLPGTFQKKAHESNAGYFGWSKSFGRFWLNPRKPFSQALAGA